MYNVDDRKVVTIRMISVTLLDFENTDSKGCLTLGSATGELSINNYLDRLVHCCFICRYLETMVGSKQSFLHHKET